MKEEFEILIKRKIEEAKEKKAKREEIQRLLDENAKTLTPDLSDIRLIPTIYRWCKELQNEENNANSRKKSLFIVMTLYAPNVLLLGDRMPAGLRKELSKVCKCHPSAISIDAANVMLLYSRYADFRQDVSILYSSVVDRLRCDELI